jgi:hypothetical protein
VVDEGVEEDDIVPDTDCVGATLGVALEDAVCVCEGTRKKLAMRRLLL